MIVDVEKRQQARVVEIAPDGKVRTLLEAAPGAMLSGPNWSPDGKRVLVRQRIATASLNSTYIIDAAGAKATELMRGEHSPCDWMTDRSIVCAERQSGTIALVEFGLTSSFALDGRRVHYVLPVYHDIGNLRVTAKGAFMATESNARHLDLV